MTRLKSTQVMWLALAVLLALWALPTAALRAQGDRVIYEDTFNENYSGWKLATTDSSELKVEEGALTLRTTDPGLASWATPAVTVPDDVEVEVEATLINPASNGEWNLGLILRADTRGLDAAFYHFGITGGGLWEFRKRLKQADSYTVSIVDGRLSNFDPRQPIRLKVVARQNTFTFLVNGVEVGTFEDASLPLDPGIEKYIGLMCGTYEGANTQTVAFRSLRVTEAETGEVLLRETFDAANPNDWSVGTGTDSDAELRDNALLITVKNANIIRWSKPRKVTFPADVDVTVRVVNDDPDDAGAWGYGIGVRGYEESDSTYFYLFEVHGTGEYAFTAQQGGNVTKTIIRRTAIPNFDPAAVNTLRVVAQGDTFTLYVNGVEVGSARDSSLKTQPAYHVLLTGGTFEESPQMMARFTDLVVTVPR